MHNLNSFILLILTIMANPLHLNADVPVLNLNPLRFDFPLQPECNVLLEQFAQNAANFTMCSIINARPIRLCERCVDQYVKFRDKFTELSKTVVNGTTCKDLLISQDRLDAVLVFHNNILAVWDKGHCDDCFTWTDNGPILSNDTNHFNKMFNETQECMFNNSSQFNNSEQICEKCMQSYLTLDDFYKSLSRDGIGVNSVCMDVVDMMNATRFVWSKTLGCCKLRNTPELIFLCCTGIISLLPFLYYLVLRYYGPIRDLPNVLKQSRFKQTFLRSRNDMTDSMISQ